MDDVLKVSLVEVCYRLSSFFSWCVGGYSRYDNVYIAREVGCNSVRRDARWF